MNLAYVIASVLYFALVVGAGLCAAKGETREEFLIGARQYNALLLAASIGASWISAGGLMIIFNMISTDLTTLVSIELGFALSLTLLAFIAPRLRQLAIQHEAYSMTELVEKLIGKRFALLVAFFLFVIYSGWLLLELVGTAQLLASFSGWAYEIVVLVLTTVIAVYLWAGGFQALMRTDFLQAIFIGVLFLTFFVLPDHLQFPDLHTFGAGQSFSFPAAVGGLAIGIISTFCGAEIWQRAIAARSGMDGKKGLLWAALTLLLASLFLWYVAFGIYQAYPEASPATYLSLLSGAVPSWFAPLLFVCLMALVMSTLDTAGFVAAQTLMNDGIYKLTGKEVEHPQRILRIGILVTFLTSAGLAMVFRDVIEILYFLFAYWGLLTPALFVFLTKSPPSEKSLIISVLLGFIGITGLQIAGVYQDWMNVFTIAGLLILPPVLDRARGKTYRVQA